MNRLIMTLMMFKFNKWKINNNMIHKNIKKIEKNKKFLIHSDIKILKRHVLNL